MNEGVDVVFGARKDSKEKMSGDAGEIKDARQKAEERAEELIRKAAEASGDSPASASDAFVSVPEGKMLVDKKEFEDLKEQLKTLAELKDKWIRQVADYENAKKRLRREQDDFIKFAHQGLVSELLPVLRNLDRVIHHAGKQNTQKDPIVLGVELVIKQVHQLLESNGVKRIESVGKPFDPHVHEAVAHAPSDLPEETVIEESEPGYMLHDRLLCPAKVIVSKGPQASGDKNPSEHSS